MFSELQLIDWLPFMFVMVAAGLVHGTLGMGFPLIATPMLAMLVDLRSAILITLLPTVVVNVASLLRGGNWAQSLGRFWPLAVYSVLGGFVGAYVIARIDPDPFNLLLAALILLYLLSPKTRFMPGRFIQEQSQLSMLTFGLVAGFSAGATNVMVPILIIYTLELALPRPTMVQIFNACFVAGKLAQIVIFSMLGLYSFDEALSTAPLAIAAFAALLIGVKIQDQIPTELYRRCVRVLLYVLAGLLVVQYIL